MKALLMKDYCIMIRNGRQMLIVPLVFLVLAVVSGELIWTMWPVFFIGLMPYTIMSYEEQSGWILYAETMPYGRKLIVCEKYALMLINGAVLTILLSVISAVIMLMKNQFSFNILCQLSVIYAAGTLLPGTLTMPMVFKYGCNKGRTAYLFILAVFGGLMGAVSSLSKDAAITQMLQGNQHFMFALLLPVVLILLVLSAALSVRLYQKREL